MILYNDFILVNKILFHTQGNPLKKRRPEMDTYGFHGDTFSGGFGDFHPAKRQQQYRLPFDDAGGFGQLKTHPFFFQDQKMKV